MLALRWELNVVGFSLFLWLIAFSDYITAGVEIHEMGVCTNMYFCKL